MIKRKIRVLEKKERQKYTFYKDKPHILTFESKQKVGFKNLKTGDEWSFKKNRSGASPVSLKDEQISFGLPAMSQICYPGQTIRISTGWNSQSLPKDQMMMTYPSNYLLGADIVGLTQLYGQMIKGNELSTTLLNSGTQPIVFEVNPIEGVLNVFRINEDGLMTENLSDFNWGEFATAALTTAVHLLPIFI